MLFKKRTKSSEEKDKAPVPGPIANDSLAEANSSGCMVQERPISPTPTTKSSRSLSMGRRHWSLFRRMKEAQIDGDDDDSVRTQSSIPSDPDFLTHTTQEWNSLAHTTQGVPSSPNNVSGRPNSSPGQLRVPTVVRSGMAVNEGKNERIGSSQSSPSNSYISPVTMTRSMNQNSLSQNTTESPQSATGPLALEPYQIQTARKRSNTAPTEVLDTRPTTVLISIIFKLFQLF